MAGRPGRSGGANRISLEQHVLRGTYNATRHGPRPALLTPVASPRTEPTPEDVTVGLTGRGLAFVDSCWQSYTGWSPASRVLLREAGHLIEQLEQLRGQRGERAAQRLLLSTIAALQLKD